MTPDERDSQKLRSAGSQDTEILAKFGISRIPVDYFHYKGFRYTNLQDAIAQAERDNQRSISDTN